MSVLRLGTACRTTLPPRPPSPPSGPPNSMNFSRRKATTPAPPSPAFTWILASSRNFIVRKQTELKRGGRRTSPSNLPPRRGPLIARRFVQRGLHGDEGAPGRAALELDR